MPSEPIAAVLIHVADISAGIQWYHLAFPHAVRFRVEGCDFDFLRVGSVQIEIVPADEKVSSGASGSVVYWSVPELASALQQMQSIGAELYRVPMQIENGLSMCQVRDPWGSCIGLRGPTLSQQESVIR